MVKVDSFDFHPGKSLAGRYEIVSLLGKGYEGEVYLVKESATGIERAAKFFFPHRNKNDKASMYYAKKLHKLHRCSAIIQYHFRGTVQVKGQSVTYLVSEFMDSQMLSEYVDGHPGKRLHVFKALHVLYDIVDALIEIHELGEYHGDLHTDNIMITPIGIGFDIKVVDLFNFGSSRPSYQKDDIVDIINIFYEILGGKKHYAKLPAEIKYIICGQKRTLILKKFPTLLKLQEHLNSFEWE